MEPLGIMGLGDLGKPEAWTIGRSSFEIWGSRPRAKREARLGLGFREGLGSRLVPVTRFHVWFSN